MRDDVEANAPFDLDRQQLRRSLEQAAVRYDQAAVVQREVGDRLLDRLRLIKLNPAVILDVGCGTGNSTAKLSKHYRWARVIGVELAPAMLVAARKRTPWFRTFHGLVGEADALPLAAASCDLIFSNLALHWYLDLDRVFAEFRRILKPGGAVLFSTVGPDTLLELRQSWRAADQNYHVNAFLDLHDIGDALLRAGLAAPVMDVEHLTLTYPTLEPLLGDLKTLGASNVMVGRTRGLTGRGRWQLMRTAYERLRGADGLLPVTCEIVYGHAWGALPDQPSLRSRGGGPAVFPISQLRRR